MSDKPDRKALEEEAKKLGIKYVAVSSVNLVEAIAKAKATPQDESSNNGSDQGDSGESNGSDTPDEPIVTPSKNKKDKKEFNVAVIKKDNIEIRRYTLLLHGEDFAKLAEEFVATGVGYTVEYLKQPKGVKCPQCGHEFQP